MTPEEHDREIQLLSSEWHHLSPLQRVHRLALVEFTTADEWASAASVFHTRAAVLAWREVAAA
jgi:hypothetical protein